VKHADYLGLVVTLVLAGCAAVEQVDPVPVVSVPSIERLPEAKETRAPVVVLSDGERLLFYFERIRRMPANELAKEHDAMRAAFGRAGNDYNRVGYAMVLALPGTAFVDDGRALELLDPLSKKNESSLRGLALLLTTFIHERRRLGGSLGAAQQKLDALRTLERNLIDRGQK
jgi:hypothetical protein